MGGQLLDASGDRVEGGQLEGLVGVIESLGGFSE